MCSPDVSAPLRAWMAQRGWTPLVFQEATWRAALAGRSGLVHAPTGFGKTLAVWGAPVTAALTAARDDRADAAPALRALWLTPLRALAADTVGALRDVVQGLGLDWRVEGRTGDTQTAARRRQRASPPDALVTTPESLSVMLSLPGAGQSLSCVTWVIVDEWHELLGTKRGVQTELVLARLRALAPGIRTWGLSATIGNVPEAMQALLGAGASRGVIIRGRDVREIVVETLRPATIERFPWAGHMGLALLPDVIAQIERAATTLVFTNTRSQAETWFAAIQRERPDWLGRIALHHGSLDRSIRERVEAMLSAGTLHAVVCTSSLDLGVDFQPVEQVIQIGSPKGVARLMQRAGRSGHRPGAPSRIIGVPTSALELVEFAAARDAVAAGAVESRPTESRRLDVLVQHLVTVAAGDGFRPEAMLPEIRSTRAFADLTDEAWSWCLDFIRRGGPSLTAYPQYARVVPADDGRLIVASVPMARRHRISIGTITADQHVRVCFGNGATIGSVEERFVAMLRPGDRFTLAGRVLELVHLRDMTAVVRPAKALRGMVPRWAGGRSPLSTELSRAVRLRLDAARRGCFEGREMAVVRPLLDLQAAWSIVPAMDEVLLEVVRIRRGHHAFLFTFAGRLANEGLGMLLAWRMARERPITVQVTANDAGIELLTGVDPDLDEVAWRRLLEPVGLSADLAACANTGELARRRFRDIARIAGLVFTGFPGEVRPARHLQASSELFYRVFTAHDPENRLLEQARREVLDRELEIARLRETLVDLAARRLRIVHPRTLTPLAFPLWVERIRTQSITSERWIDRVRRMAVLLEDAAAGDGTGTTARGRRMRSARRSRPPAEVSGT